MPRRPTLRHTATWVRLAHSGSSIIALHCLFESFLMAQCLFTASDEADHCQVAERVPAVCAGTLAAAAGPVVTALSVRCSAGVIHRDAGRLEAAVACYEAALAAAPNFAIVQQNLAIALTELGTRAKLAGTPALPLLLMNRACNGVPCSDAQELTSQGHAQPQKFALSVRTCLLSDDWHTPSPTRAHPAAACACQASGRAAWRCTSERWRWRRATRTPCTTWAWRAARPGSRSARCTCTSWPSTSSPPAPRPGTTSARAPALQAVAVSRGPLPCTTCQACGTRSGQAASPHSTLSGT